MKFISENNYPFSEIFFISCLIVFICFKTFFVTNFVMLVTKFVTHVRKFVIHVTNFVIKIICADSKTYYGERKIFSVKVKKERQAVETVCLDI